MRNYARLNVNNNMTGVMKFPTLENEIYNITAYISLFIISLHTLCPSRRIQPTKIIIFFSSRNSFV